MNGETLHALRSSIHKWEMIVAGTDENKGIENCPLCSLFYDNDCMGCPVAEKTDQICCRGTPYPDAFDAEIEFECDSVEYMVMAMEELEFLQSLLPKHKPTEGKNR